MEFEKIYFFTATIHKWILSMEENSFKKIIISSLNFLHRQDLLWIYEFVIMPDHTHFIWKLLEKNGK
jgi:REP element-mobilizing transposase RayT